MLGGRRTPILPVSGCPLPSPAMVVEWFREDGESSCPVGAQKAVVLFYTSCHLFHDSVIITKFTYGVAMLTQF